MDHERIRLMEYVVEAAQILAHSCGVIRGRTPEDDDIYSVELDHIRELNAAISSLDAYRPTIPADTVPLRIAVYRDRSTGRHETDCLRGDAVAPDIDADGWTLHAIITAHVPASPPPVPVIEGECE